MSRHWVQLPERGTLGAIRLISWIGQHLGRWAGRLLLYPITLYFFLTAPSIRRASRTYLQRVLDRRPTGWHVYRHIHCYACMILDRMYFLIGQWERFDVQVHNGRLILDLVASGRGCLLLGAHLGSFEVMRALGVNVGKFPLKILMNTAHNPIMTQVMETFNPEIARTVIPIEGPETLLKVRESLENGYLVGMLADRIAASDKTVRCRFLGAEALLPAGPLLLAAALKCPVILFFGLYQGSNRYEVHFEQLADPLTLDRKQRQRDIQYWTQRYVDRLEYYVRSAPYNWFNFYDYWEKGNE